MPEFKVKDDISHENLPTTLREKPMMDRWSFFVKFLLGLGLGCFDFEIIFVLKVLLCKLVSKGGHYSF